MVPKAFKEVKQQVDIVGKGRGDHGDSSWKGFAVFSRRTCHYRLCQVIYAHPSYNSSEKEFHIDLPGVPGMGVSHYGRDDPETDRLLHALEQIYAKLYPD